MCEINCCWLSGWGFWKNVGRGKIWMWLCAQRFSSFLGGAFGISGGLIWIAENVGPFQGPELWALVVRGYSLTLKPPATDV
jgi:hypothetical protein